MATETAKRQAELEQEVIEHILEEKDLLTPAQRKKFREIILGQFSSGGLGIHDVPGRRSDKPPDFPASGAEALPGP